MAKELFNNSGGGSAAKITPTNYVVGGIPASGEIDLTRKTNEETRDTGGVTTPSAKR